jgi:hypothetical protein
MTVTAADLLSVIKPVTKEWAKQRKAEEKGSRSRSDRTYVYSDRVNFTDVADDILPDAYNHASGDGRYPVSKRQLYYACREQFQEMTGRPIQYDYFAGTLLVQYLNRHPEAADWKVTADARGTLTIPNCGHDERIPCGTLQMDGHLADADTDVDPFDVDATLRTEWPSVAAGQRYQAVLYIEKEGFEPLLEDARIAERFDLAILSNKGQSVVAARKFIDQVCRADGGVPLFVVHDFDKSGFEIAARLTSVSDWAASNDRVTYRFENEINVIDFGLRLADVEQYGLAAEECRFTGSWDWDLATEEEVEFLRSDRRVELNAFTSPQFIEWLEAKLTAHLPRRLLPDDDVLQDAYRRALVVARLNKAIEAAREDAVREARATNVPKGFRKKLETMLRGSDAEPWDLAVHKLATEAIDDE